MASEGGYDLGYRSCPCFWGDKPGSLISSLENILVFNGLFVLDLGCGEGKNAFYLAESGAKVTAVDCSDAAITNANAHFSHQNVTYSVADARTVQFSDEVFDVSIAYGLLHCFGSAEEIRAVVSKIKSSTKRGGYLVLCSFNDRDQDLSAHPGFSPFLAPHSFYVDLFSDWELVECTDQNLHETHPHNGIPHHHSLTRIICRKPQ